MEFGDVVSARRMVRRYLDRPVEAAVVDRALRRATSAPSAGFSQGWEFVVLDTPSDVRRFWTASSDDVDAPDRWLAGMMTAPVVVLPCVDRAAYLGRYAEPDKARAGLVGEHADDTSRWAMPYWHLDTAMASLLILLSVVDDGLGACFFGLVPDRVDVVRAAFAIPDGVDPVGAITLGHPAPAASPGARAAGSPSRRPKRPWRDAVHLGGW